MASMALIQARDAMRRAAMGRMLTTASIKEAAGRKRTKGDYLPVYVLAGMIALSVGFGLHTAKQQVLYAPDVHVKKSKRETLPEVFEPEAVAAESDKFINKSFFRKVAHIQEHKTPFKGDAQARKPKLESLKDIGVDPKQQ